MNTNRSAPSLKPELRNENQANTLVETWPRNISQLARPRNRSSRKSRFDGGSARSTRIRSRPISDTRPSAPSYSGAAKPWKATFENDRGPARRAIEAGQIMQLACRIQRCGGRRKRVQPESQLK